MRLRLKLPLIFLGALLVVGFGPRPTQAAVDKAFFINFHVISKTGISAVIGWDTTSADGNIERVNYGTVPNQLNTGPVYEATPGGTAHNADLTGLVPGQLYLIEVITTGKESGQRAFFFGDVLITDIKVTDITTSSAIVRFITNFAVCADLNYGLTATTLNTQVRECPSPDVSYNPTTVHTIPLSGLSEGTEYFFNIAVFGDDSATTPTQSFSTLSTASPPPPPTSSNLASITSVNVTQVTKTDATIFFTYSSSLPPGSLQYQVAYDLSAKYSTFTPPKTLASPFGSDIVVLSNLTSSTTYHFSIQLCNVPTPAGACKATDMVVVSADRTFTTGSTSGGSAKLLISSIKTDCVDKHCIVYFSTNLVSKVEICWDVTNPGTFPFGTCTAESANGVGLRSLRIPDIAQPDLIKNTLYHYRLHADDGFGNTFTTGDLTLTTSANSTDHTFATGSCSSGGVTVDIGSCLGSKLCLAGGLLFDDCTKCGYVCPVLETCRQGGLAGQCTPDPALNGSASQCNESACYSSNRTFLSPAAAKCYSSWSSCTANTILKVRNDRGCNLWLTCETSLQTTASASGPAENLCLTLGACNSLNSKGQCNNYLPAGQCDNDPLRFCYRDIDCQGSGTCNNPDPDAPTKALRTMTYVMPTDQSRMSNLSGNVVAGIDWGLQGGANVIQGLLPWQLMRQIGGVSQVINGDFERRAPEFTPWTTAPLDDSGQTTISVDFEEKNTGPNHVLQVEPDLNRSFSGAASGVFITSPAEYYYAVARIKAENGSPRVQVRFGYDNYQTFQVLDENNNKIATSVTITATSAWQRVTLGPIKNMVGATRVGVVCADTTNCSAFEVDDVQVKPILQVDTNPNYITPSCRLYPKNDSPACDYLDTNDVQYRGWHGYCLEHDSQTGTCLSWWPVDIIKGDSNIFGAEKTAGYNDRQPLFLCAESAGNSFVRYCSTDVNKRCSADLDCGGGTCKNFGTSDTTGTRRPYDTETYYGSAKYPNSKFTIMTNGTSGDTGNVNAGYDDAALREEDIRAVVWYPYPTQFSYQNPEFDMENDQVFQDTTNGGFLGPFPYPAGDNQRNTYTIRRSTARHCTETAAGQYCNDNGDVLWMIVSGCRPGETNDSKNCIAHMWLVFDKITGLLKKYIFDAWDTTGRQEEIVYKVRLFLREPCRKIVEVVTQDGFNQAYAQRVKSNTYHVETLTYDRKVDLPPFGGVLSPIKHTSDPTKWPILAAETRSLEYSSPGQARAGTPYACAGNCQKFFCASKVGVGSSPIQQNQKDCSTAAGAAACKNLDSDQDGTPDGVCIGVNTPNSSAATGQGDQTFDPLHDPTKVLPADNAFFAQERMRRLFAKSYGVWERSFDTGGAKYDTYVVKGTPTYVVFLGHCSKFGASCVNDASCQAAFPGSVCSGIRFYRATVICSSSQKYQEYNAGPPISCTATSCSTTVEKTSGGSDRSEQGAINSAFRLCNGQVACANKPQCIGSTGSYSFKPDQGWTGPTDMCKILPSNKVERGGFPFDFCAVPPKISNIGFVDTNEKDIYLLGGNGQISLRFNTQVDPEQVPLQTIKIDWGNGELPQVIPFPFAPHNDPRNPHVFTKAYKCPTLGTCKFFIKIQVIDNWDWGNDATKNGSATDVDTTADTKSQDDSLNWFDPGLTVHVDR